MAMACVIQKLASTQVMDFSFLILILILMLKLNCLLASTEPIRIINRTSFPRDFIFGTASSSYQYEGEANGGGRGPNIWDTFTHKYPERIYDGRNGDESVDFYHRYKEDVSIMKDMGLDAFRLSISWSRILPSGKLSGGVNKQGIDFYNNLINELLANGLQPFVTIFHWDTPQPLEDDYGGFLSPRIVDDFEDFAQVCFREFGDRVKHWITMNGPDIYANLGYATGEYAPARCSQWLSGACKAGNSATEPYIVAHHLLLSHAAAAALYKNKYQALQRGEIGLTMSIDWAVPYSNTSADSEAAARAIDFMFGWFMEPLTYGEYPWIMRTLVGERLPILTKEQSEMVKGSFDFIGINYYSAKYAANIPFPNLVNITYSTDARANLTGVRNGVPIGPQAASIWIYSYPRGLYDLLIYTKERYNNPTIYITENGVDEYNNSTLSLNEALQDPMRIAYHHDHLVFLQQAIKEGVKVKGYFAWSLLDNFEWFLGYTVRFGFNFVDYDNGLKRYPKQSAIWFKNFLMKQAQHSDY